MSWFLHTKDIKPYGSAVLNGNYAFFYTVHFSGIILLVLSMALCILVVVSIRFRLKKERWDFSDRFPFYLAISDFLWGASHVTDHFLLLLTETYPSSTASKAMSITGWIFFGYQQMMHIGLAGYIYLKVVKRKHFDLGRGEWKLHLHSIAIPITTVLLFVGFDTFGPSGYWFLLNPNSVSGKTLGYISVLMALIHAAGVHLAYKKIQIAIDAQHETMTIYECKSQFLEIPSLPRHQQQPKKSMNRRHSVATQCLTSFIRMYIIIFYPLALIMGAYTIEYTFEVLEPITIMFCVVVANFCGTANAIIYFYNERIKKKDMMDRCSETPTPSVLSANSKFITCD